MMNNTIYTGLLSLFFEVFAYFKKSFTLCNMQAIVGARDIFN